MRPETVSTALLLACVVTLAIISLSLLNGRVRADGRIADLEREVAGVKTVLARRLRPRTGEALRDVLASREGFADERN